MDSGKIERKIICLFFLTLVIYTLFK